MTPPSPQAALLALMRDTSRGPKREGLFALWLTVRVAEDQADTAFAERAQRRRVAALEKRLTSLALPAPLRRGLAAALSDLRTGTAEAGALALSRLAAPARDSLGADAAEAVQRAARRVAATPAPGYR